MAPGKLIALLLLLLAAAALVASSRVSGDIDERVPSDVTVALADDSSSPSADDSADASDAAGNDEVIVFTRGEGGYYCIKIPYLFVTSAGTLLSFGEGRFVTCSDYAATDLVWKRSTDGGASWSALQIVYSNSSSTETNVIGNAAPVQDRNTGTILMPFCRNNLEVWFTQSVDDGLSWARPYMLTGVTKKEWLFIGTGPPGGLQLSTRYWNDRILIPAYHSTVPGDNGEFSEDHVILSDDGGKTWYLGGSFDFGAQFPNENSAVELADGTVFINARGLGAARIGAYSTDGGLSFPASSVMQLSDLIEPPIGCQGSTVRDNVTGTLFFSGLHESTLLRFNLSMHRSDDNGITWSAYHVVRNGSTAYSSLAWLADGSLGLLYEWSKEEKLIFDPDYFSFVIVPTTAETKGAATPAPRIIDELSSEFELE